MSRGGEQRALKKGHAPVKQETEGGQTPSDPCVPRRRRKEGGRDREIGVPGFAMDENNCKSRQKKGKGVAEVKGVHHRVKRTKGNVRVHSKEKKEKRRGRRSENSRLGRKKVDPTTKGGEKDKPDWEVHRENAGGVQGWRWGGGGKANQKKQQA